MADYQEIPELAAFVLEESYVLDIRAQPGTVEFWLDFVLTPEHGEYVSPEPTESYCYRRGRLSFSGVSSCVWTDQGAPPARDASGEVDYGNIDSFEWDGSGYELAGDWGTMALTARSVKAELDPQSVEA